MLKMQNRYRTRNYSSMARSSNKNSIVVPYSSTAIRKGQFNLPSIVPNSKVIALNSRFSRKNHSHLSRISEYRKQSNFKSKANASFELKFSEKIPSQVFPTDHSLEITEKRLSNLFTKVNMNYGNPNRYEYSGNHNGLKMYDFAKHCGASLDYGRLKESPEKRMRRVDIMQLLLTRAHSRNDENHSNEVFGMLQASNLRIKDRKNSREKMAKILNKTGNGGLNNTPDLTTDKSARKIFNNEILQKLIGGKRPKNPEKNLN